MLDQTEPLVTLFDTFTGPGAPGAQQVAEVLADLGWWVTGRRAGNWEEWANGDFRGFREAFGPIDSFQVITVLLEPEEGADFDELYQRFEDGFDQLSAWVQDRLGEPTMTSEFDDPQLPIPGQFDRADVWPAEPWSVMTSFQHEDKEAPLRLALWFFREG
ncbi:hypothetical protein [Actinoplanes palleronii]|uniref:Uncharacterized protein n=1 Tax=Actinoplanes palleronii TaxID=113570 RepID=A0ABQ4B130_9ACTN|nr:hypothetical protein [Actinoplanes palleronii]GIE64382.1 hypothetical protein Apa02nite_004900 [Actinoplanes palleronii]